MSYSLSDAAKATGKNRTTIQRAIKSGKISASKNENGAYEIAPAELHKIFQPLRNTVRNSQKRRAATARNGPMQYQKRSALDWKCWKKSGTAKGRNWKKPSPICARTGTSGVSRQPPCLRIIAQKDFSKGFSDADCAPP